MDKGKWYFKTYWLVIAFLSIGPLALPLLWLNPRYNLKRKIIVSVIVIIISYYLIAATIKSLKTIRDYYELMFHQF